MKTLYNVVNAIICCAKEARALITGNPGSLLVSRTYGAKFRSGNLLEMVTLLIALQIWCPSEVRTRQAGRKGNFGNFLSFLLKVHNYYPAYHIGPDFSN